MYFFYHFRSAILLRPISQIDHDGFSIDRTLWHNSNGSLLSFSVNLVTFRLPFPYYHSDISRHLLIGREIYPAIGRVPGVRSGERDPEQKAECWDQESVRNEDDHRHALTCGGEQKKKLWKQFPKYVRM